MSIGEAGNQSRIAVILINMGGPAALDKIRSFMFNLFNDRHIMDMPQPFRALVAQIIVAVRTPNVKHHYSLIGGRSPLMQWTERQGTLIEAELKMKFPNLKIGFAYSYIEPSIGEAIEKAVADGADKIIAVPLYPYYSVSTLGSIYTGLEKARRKHELGDKLRITRPFYDHPKFIDGTIDLLKEAIGKVDITEPYHVLFTAHALPESFILKGDPYRSQVERTVALILQNFPTKNTFLSFQSKIGPVAWMKPSTIETVKRLGKEGVKQLVVMPLGFVCDHIETLYELDIELAGIAKEAGIMQFVRGRVFNDHSAFITLLGALIEECL
ncbi:putative Ferrochelatase [Candidatus Zixiibacteriota bacterium]|nr:putative Ferrochelatase [candidate division Zixibacteria bacterium]